MNAPAAYDYTAQKWATGNDAVALRREQLRADLALLESPKGADYLRFIGSDMSLSSAIVKCRESMMATYS